MLSKILANLGQTAVTAFKELDDWDEFWARYGQEAEDGGGRKACSWTALKANIKKHRSMLDARGCGPCKGTV